MQAFSKPTKVLKDVGVDDLEVVAVDVDGSPDIYQLPDVKKLFGGLVNAPVGAGGAAFCREGQIIHADILGSGDSPNQYEVNAREFLSSSGVE